LIKEYCMSGKSTPERSCFFISPIGGRDSDARRRSNDVMEYLLRDRLAASGYALVRADQLSDLGRIDDHVIDHLLDDDLAVCDLTGLNPNVMYELGVRHAAGKPVIIIAENGTVLPFDAQRFRTLFYSLDSVALMHEAQSGLDEILERLDSGGVLSNPIADRSSQRLLANSSGVVEEALVRIEAQVGMMANELHRQGEGVSQARFELGNGNYEAAIQLYEEYLAHSPDDAQALIGLARAQRRMHFYQRSVDTLGVLLESEPRNPQARYNMACYLCLAGADVADVVKNLAVAIRTSTRYREYALSDPDLERVREMSEFAAVVGLGDP
jgi:tetratricopeptide (TPR) repeat protein